MKNFIDALNSINSQVWAFLMLCLGLTSAFVFHKANMDIAIAAGVIGAAVQLFQSTTKTQTASSATATTVTSGPDTVPPLTPVPAAKETL